jgi:hypothetical protein
MQCLSARNGLRALRPCSSRISTLAPRTLQHAPKWLVRAQPEAPSTAEATFEEGEQLTGDYCSLDSAGKRIRQENRTVGGCAAWADLGAGIDMGTSMTVVCRLASSCTLHAAPASCTCVAAAAAAACSLVLLLYTAHCHCAVHHSLLCNNMLGFTWFRKQRQFICAVLTSATQLNPSQHHPPALQEPAVVGTMCRAIPPKALK